MTDPVSKRVPYDILLANPGRVSPQWGILGMDCGDRNRKVALDLNTINCSCLFGEPGVGKSYALGVYTEMALVPIQGINALPNPWGSVVFHYTPSPVYKPELAASFLPNHKSDQLTLLKEQYQADPAAVGEIVILAPRGMVIERREEFGAITPLSAEPQLPWKGIRVEALSFRSEQLTATQWKILMGAIGEDDSLYLQVINQILRDCRETKRPITIETIRAGIDSSRLTEEDKDRAGIRLRLAAEYIDDQGPALGAWLKRGRMVIIDLRDEFIQKREALSLAIVMLQLFADTTEVDGTPLQKLFVLDEAHKYLTDPFLVAYLTEIIREMRHKATSVMIASQDPLSVPDIIIELASLMIVLKMSSPQWLNHIKRVKGAFTDITTTVMQNLRQGEAFVWAKFASDEQFAKEAIKLKIRPRATRHGGDTRTAIAEA